jgi:hypothetical protein
MILRQIYIVFLGIMLALFVGVGIAAFYIAPQPPKTTPYIPPAPVMEKGSPQNDQAVMEQQRQWQQEYDAYDTAQKAYTRNVSIIAIIFAVLFLVISLIFLSKMIILSDGFLFGSLCTLIYSIFRGFESDNSKYRFLVVTVSLLIALIVGYVKFLKTSLVNSQSK